MRIGLILLSITLCMWFTLFLIFLCSAVFPGNSKIVVMLDPIVSQVSLPGIGLINLLICVGGIVCSRFRGENQLKGVFLFERRSALLAVVCWYLGYS